MKNVVILSRNVVEARYHKGGVRRFKTGVIKTGVIKTGVIKTGVIAPRLAQVERVGFHWW